MDVASLLISLHPKTDLPLPALALCHDFDRQQVLARREILHGYIDLKVRGTPRADRRAFERLGELRNDIVLAVPDPRRDRGGRKCRPVLIRTEKRGDLVGRPERPARRWDYRQQIRKGVGGGGPKRRFHAEDESRE